MPLIADAAYDAALSYVQSNGTRLDICSSEPTNYADAVTVGGATGVSLGNKTALTIGVPEPGDIDGRKVVVDAINDGSVTADGTAAFYAVTDGVGELLAAGALDTNQVVTLNNSFTLGAFNITLRDATAS